MIALLFKAQNGLCWTDFIIEQCSRPWQAIRLRARSFIYLKCCRHGNGVCCHWAFRLISQISPSADNTRSPLQWVRKHNVNKGRHFPSIKCRHRTGKVFKSVFAGGGGEWRFGSSNKQEKNGETCDILWLSFSSSLLHSRVGKEISDKMNHTLGPRPQGAEFTRLVFLLRVRKDRSILQSSAAWSRTARRVVAARPGWYLPIRQLSCAKLSGVFEVRERRSPSVSRFIVCQWRPRAHPVNIRVSWPVALIGYPLTGPTHYW